MKDFMNFRSKENLIFM